MPRFIGTIFVFAIGLPTLTAISAATVAAQVPTAPPKAAGPTCMDKVAITEFKIAPGNPGPGAKTVLTLVMKNLCSGTAPTTVITVPWRITVGTVVLASGAVLIPPGGTGIGRASWTAPVTGKFTFDAEADPANTLGEPAAARANNLPDGFEVTIVVTKPTHRGQSSPDQIDQPTNQVQLWTRHNWRAIATNQEKP